jgi:two-component system, cell cycle sensor histidine kinase and response regulator CckA
MIDLMITDVVMPLRSGKELASRMAEKHPGIRVLFMSGYTDDSIVHHGVLDPGVQFLEKPFTYNSLTKKVGDILDGHV